jgi:toxin ParE1/3/4
MPCVFKQAWAEQDLLDIWLHTFTERGERQADAYLDDLSEVISLLAEQPQIARERTEFSPPVRIHPHAHHLIVYIANSGGVNIVRVLHESMDVDEHLER